MNILARVVTAFIIGFGLDWMSKVRAEQTLDLHQPVPVIGETFRFTLGYNTGVAFGLFSNNGVWPLVVTGIVILGLSVWFAHGIYRQEFSPRAGWAIGLVLSGALGNFIDRFFDGRVTDFLDVGLGSSRWPTFNLADSFILIGLALLMLSEAQTPGEVSMSDPDVDEGEGMVSRSQTEFGNQ
ncbi:MAG: signal peptidase II [Anaerolineae bacterium]|nr:signal peptidase II [Anaerolineae bacterium]